MIKSESGEGRGYRSGLKSKPRLMKLLLELDTLS